MTKIEFILLTDNLRINDLYDVICQWVQRIHHKGGVYIQMRDEAESKALDNYLWAFADSFIPHMLAGENSIVGYDDSDVVIGWQAEPNGSHRALLNASSTVPWFFARFEHLIELVQGDENGRRIGRKHYLYYKRRGYFLQHRQFLGIR